MTNQQNVATDAEIAHLRKWSATDSPVQRALNRLAALLAEREIATLEKAAKLVCGDCRDGFRPSSGWHRFDGVFSPPDRRCDAEPIHALIAQLKEAR